MPRFNISLIKGTNVVLNLRAAAQKFGYTSGVSLAEHIDMQERKIRRILSGHQEPKVSDLEKFSKLFEIPEYMFLKKNTYFIEFINECFEDLPISRVEISPMFNIEEIKDFKIILFGVKSGVVILQGGNGYFTETIEYTCTEAEAVVHFEAQCLQYNDNVKIEIGVLMSEHQVVQTYNRERLQIREALQHKVLEIWQQVNADVAALWEEEPFNIYSPSADRFLRILSNQEYELIMSLRSEIFPHKIEQE